MPRKDRKWMYQRFLSDNTLSVEYLLKVDDFVREAFKHRSCVIRRDNVDKIRCPCCVCDNTRFLTGDEVRKHLFTKGFTLYYTCWRHHGETRVRKSPKRVAVDELPGRHQSKFPVLDNIISSSSSSDVGEGSNRMAVDKLPGRRKSKFPVLGNIISSSSSSDVPSASSAIRGGALLYEDDDDDDDDKDYVPGVETVEEDSIGREIPKNEFDASDYDESSFDFEVPTSDEEAS